MKKNRLFVGMMATCILAAGLVGCGSSAAPEATKASGNAGTEAAAAAAGEGVGPWKSGDNVYVDVPAKAGGGTDLYTRYLTQALSEARGSNVKLYVPQRGDMAKLVSMAYTNAVERLAR